MKYNEYRQNVGHVTMQHWKWDTIPPHSDKRQS
jgi:hypothetical protein